MSLKKTSWHSSLSWPKDANNNPNWTLQGSVLLHQPTKNIFRSLKNAQITINTKVPFLGVLIAFLQSTFNLYHKSRIYLEEYVFRIPLSA